MNEFQSFVEGLAYQHRVCEAVQLFDANSDALAHFVLILQTPEWACVTIVHKPTGATQVGPVQPPTLPAPPNA